MFIVKRKRIYRPGVLKTELRASVMQLYLSRLSNTEKLYSCFFTNNAVYFNTTYYVLPKQDSYHCKKKNLETAITLILS